MVAKQFSRFFRKTNFALITTLSKVLELNSNSPNLDNAEIAQKLLSFSEENLQKVTLHVPAMHCSSCIWLLENLYKIKEGISYSRVNFMRREITLSYNPQVITFRQVAEVLTSLGYEPKINLQDLEQKAKKGENKVLFYKIGIAGFSFGNIMLLSFPDYLALQDWVGSNEKWFFGMANILFALPIFFYCSTDYFKSAYKALRAKVVNLDVPITIGIFALFFRSLYEILSQTGAGYMDSLAGLLFFLLIGKWFQERTYQSMSFERDYKSYFPLAVRVKEQAQETKVVTDLKKGDMIEIRNRELIPADSILLSEQAFIDYSFVTGESEPIEKHKGQYIYAGGRQVGSSIDLAVQKEVTQSYLTQLWNSETFQKDQNVKINKRVAMFSKYFTYATLSLATISAIIWNFIDPTYTWKVFTAVLIVACPCALALSMPYALGNTLRIFGRNKFYLKNADVVAEIAEIEHVVFDKTGTLTHSDEGLLEFISAENQTLSEEDKIYIKSLAKHSTHPLSRRIAKFLTDIKPQDLEYFEEMEGKGMFGKLGNTGIKLGSAKFLDLESQHFEKSQESRVYVKITDTLKGYFRIKNHYRAGFEDLVESTQANYELSLISGDNSGEEAFLREHLGKDANLQFNQQPKDKLDFVEDLQKEESKVMMLGDGLNDAGALQQSDVGIAISEDTTAFSPACDAILDAEAFAKLPKLLAFSKTAVNIVRASFILSLLYNLTGVIVAMTGNLSPVFAAILMPASSISVVLFVVLMSNFLAKKRGLL